MPNWIKRLTLKKQLNDPYKMESVRKLHLASVISAILTILGFLIMGPLSLAQGNTTMALSSFAYGSLALFSLIYTIVRKNLIGFDIVTIVMTYFLIILYLITGGNEGFGLTWILIFPLLYLYMLTPKMFISLVSINLALIITAFFTPLNKYIYQGWNTAYKIRFVLEMVIESIISVGFRISSYATEKSKKEILNNLMEFQNTLQNKVDERTLALVKEKERSEKFLIELSMSLAATIDAKDKYTSGHSKRVAEYSMEIAKRLGKSREEQQRIYLIALLHDIGKIGVPDDIINKKTKLTEEEFNIVKKHPEIGSEILKNIESIPEIRTGVRWHHERYDGKGYPDGLKGEDIPEYAQIVAVADAYDAMTSNRSYRNLLPQSVVRKEIENGIDRQFSKKMASVMLTIIDDDKNYTLHE